MPLDNPNESAIKIAMRGLAGGVNNDNIRILDLIVTPTVAMNFVVPITEHGFTTITNVMAIAERDTTDPVSVPNVAIKSKSKDAVAFNLTQGSALTATVLGINVVSGPPIVAATNLQSITLHIRIEGT